MKKDQKKSKSKVLTFLGAAVVTAVIFGTAFIAVDPQRSKKMGEKSLYFFKKNFLKFRKWLKKKFSKPLKKEFKKGYHAPTQSTKEVGEEAITKISGVDLVPTIAKASGVLVGVVALFVGLKNLPSSKKKTPTEKSKREKK